MKCSLFLPFIEIVSYNYRCDRFGRPGAWTASLFRDAVTGGTIENPGEMKGMAQCNVFLFCSILLTPILILESLKNELHDLPLHQDV